MHIQEGTNTTLTTCSKMTEEVDRRHGVNGNSSSKGATEESVHSSAQGSSGGRLKFFKDGKFILELVRGCAREGERAGWVSVPRKTFWPPAAPPPTPPAPFHPPPACLSVSDDNSSIQSSPWQRDHCWKQTAPRKNISKELTVFYCRPNTLHTPTIKSGSRAKRRRPYDTRHWENIINGFKKPLSNGICEKKRNGDVESTDGTASRSEDAVDGAAAEDAGGKTTSDDDRWTDLGRETYYHMKLKKPYQYHKLRVYKKIGPAGRRKDLSKIIDRLREKIASLPVPAVAKLASCRQEHTMVSPRKRILRELERVSLEDQAASNKRRAKTVPTLSTASYPPAPSPGPSHAAHKPPADAPPAPSPVPTSARSHNGVGPRKEPPITKNVSSYSIHSLLSMPDEGGARRSPDAKRSPHSHPPSVKTESPASVHSPDLSPSPDGYRYRYSALALGSPGRGGGHESPTPPADVARYRAAYSAPAPAPAPASPYGRQWGGGGGGGGGIAQYRGSPARDEWREVSYVYPYPYAPAPLYRAPPPLWMHYAMAPGLPPGPWAPLPHPLLTDHVAKDEPGTDLPLNLSKH